MNASIWVGEVEGKTLVYDPSIHFPDCPHLFLWDPSTGEMGKYIADLIRKQIKPHTEPSAAAGHIAAYEQWRKTYGTAWINDEKRYYESRRDREATLEKQRQETERIANLSPEERHKERLEKLGREYRGVRPPTPNAHRRRVRHCYVCKQDIDNSVDFECVACDWILCTCGACGCGYSGFA